MEQGTAEFLTSGYHGTGIKQVLDAVGVPKGSFYNYFDSKETFARAVVEHYSACTQRDLAAALGPAPDPLTGLRMFFTGLMDGFTASEFTGGCLIANLGAEIEGSSEPVRASLSAAFDRWRDGVADALRQAQEQGSIRTDIPARELADLLIEAWEGAVIRMKIDRSIEPLRTCLRRLLDDYFRP